MDGELFTCAFVECALPPVGEVIDGVEQAFGAQFFAVMENIDTC